MSGIVPNLTPLLEVNKSIYPEGGFEMNAPMANYAGPRTNIQLREQLGKPYNQPTSKVDSFCKIHDWDYQKVYDDYKNGRINRAEAERMTRDADNKLQNSIKKSGEKGVVNKIHGYIANNGMALKKKMEDMGAMDKLNFSVGSDVIKQVEGGKRKNPIKKLQKKALKQLGKGGKYAIALYSPVKSKVTGKIYNNKMILRQKEGKKIDYIDLKNKDLHSLIASVSGGMYKKHYVLM